MYQIRLDANLRMSVVSAFGRQGWHQCNRTCHLIRLVFGGGEIASACHKEAMREAAPARIVLEYTRQ